LKFISNKKGASIDNLWIAVSFFAFAISVFLGLFVWNVISTGTVDTDIFQQTTVGINSKQSAQDFYDGIDNWIIMIYIFIHLGIIITAFLLRSHPIMYVVGIFLIIILVYITVPLTDAWNQVYTEDDFSDIKNDIYKTNILMNNYTKIEVIWAFITLVILAGLAKSEGFL